MNDWSAFNATLLLCHPHLESREKECLIPFILNSELTLHHFLRLSGVTQAQFSQTIKGLKQQNIVKSKQRGSVYYLNTYALLRNIRYPVALKGYLKYTPVRFPRILLFHKESIIPYTLPLASMKEGRISIKDYFNLSLHYGTLSKFAKKKKKTIALRTPKEIRQSHDSANALSATKFWNSCGRSKVKPYVPDFSPRTMSTFKSMLKTIQYDDLVIAIKNYYGTDESFIKERKFPIGLFKANINYYLTASKKQDKEKRVYPKSFYDLQPSDDEFYRGTIVEIKANVATLEDTKYVRDKQKHFKGKANSNILRYIEKLEAKQK